MASRKRKSNPGSSKPLKRSRRINKSPPPVISEESNPFSEEESLEMVASLSSIFQTRPSTFVRASDRFSDALREARQARRDFAIFWERFKRVTDYQLLFYAGNDIPLDFIHDSRLNNKSISYNPLQDGFSANGGTFIINTPTISDIVSIADEVIDSGEAGIARVHIRGPAGCGKSFASVMSALKQRSMSDRHVVLINNPMAIANHPERLFYELIYAFADEDLPESQSFGDHPMELIRKVYEDCLSNNFRRCHKALDDLMESLAQKCDLINRKLILYLDKVDDLWCQGEDHKNAAYLSGDFQDHFHRVIAISTATNDLLPQSYRSQYIPKDIVPKFDRSQLTFLVKAFLNLNLIPESVISEIIQYVGNNILDLMQLLQSDKPSLREKIDDYARGHEDRIQTFFDMHSSWIKSHGATNAYFMKNYIGLCALADTGIPVSLDKPSGQHAGPIFNHLDKQVFCYNESNKTLWTVSPAARIAVNMVIIRLRSLYPTDVTEFLGPNSIEKVEVQRNLVQTLLHSVFINRRRLIARHEDCWQLWIPSIGDCVVSNRVCFSNLSNLPTSLAALENVDVYFPIICMGDITVADVILFNPARKKFIFSQATAHAQGHAISNDIILSANGSGGAELNFKKLLDWVLDFIGRPKDARRAEKNFKESIAIFFIVAISDGLDIGCRNKITSIAIGHFLELATLNRAYELTRELLNDVEIIRMYRENVATAAQSSP